MTTTPPAPLVIPKNFTAHERFLVEKSELALKVAHVMVLLQCMPAIQLRGGIRRSKVTTVSGPLRSDAESNGSLVRNSTSCWSGFRHNAPN